MVSTCLASMLISPAISACCRYNSICLFLASGDIWCSLCPLTFSTILLYMSLLLSSVLLKSEFSVTLNFFFKKENSTSVRLLKRCISLALGFCPDFSLLAISKVLVKYSLYLPSFFASSLANFNSLWNINSSAEFSISSIFFSLASTLKSLSLRMSYIFWALLLLTSCRLNSPFLFFSIPKNFIAFLARGVKPCSSFISSWDS